VRLDIIRDEAGFAALEPHWDALLEQSATPTPFMRWDWVRLWWEEFHSDYKLALAVVRDDDGVPQAIAPLMIGPEKEGMRRFMRHLGFLAGLGEAKGERMDFLVPAGREEALTPLLCRSFHELSGCWDAVRLNKLPEESPNHPFIVQALREYSVGMGVVTRTECACMILESNWSAYEPKLPGKRRRELRRRWELLMMEPGSRKMQATADDAGRRMDDFAALHALHFPKGVSSFLKPRAWRFHRRLGVLWLAGGRAMLPFIESSGTMVGSIYGFVERREFLFFQIGWHPDYSRHSMGHLSVRWAADCCMQRGLKLFDMLPGSHRYKADWTQTTRHVLDLEGYQPESLLAIAFRTLRGLKRLLARLTSESATAE